MGHSNAVFVHNEDKALSRAHHLYDKSKENLATAQRKMYDHLASGAEIRCNDEKRASDHRDTLEKKIECLENEMIIIKEMLGLLDKRKEGWEVLYTTRGTGGAALWIHLDDDTLHWEGYSRWSNFDEIGFHTYDTPKYVYPIDDTEDGNEQRVKRLLAEYDENKAKTPSVIWTIPEGSKLTENFSHPGQMHVALNRDKSKWSWSFEIKGPLESWMVKGWLPIDKEGTSFYLGKPRPDARVEGVRLALIDGKLGKPVMGVDPFSKGE